MSEPREDTAPPSAAAALMARRFRGYLPVAIDVETGGFHPATDALLEIAALFIDMDGDGALKRGATHDFHVQPFAGGRLDPTSLSITGIDPFHPLRPSLPERDALQRVFREIRHAVLSYGCRRPILFGHNARYDVQRRPPPCCLLCTRPPPSHHPAAGRAREPGWLADAAGPDAEDPGA